jgi:hypothetical protein
LAPVPVLSKKPLIVHIPPGIIPFSEYDVGLRKETKETNVVLAVVAVVAVPVFNAVSKSAVGPVVPAVTVVLVLRSK